MIECLLNHIITVIYKGFEVFFVFFEVYDFLIFLLDLLLKVEIFLSLCFEHLLKEVYLGLGHGFVLDIGWVFYVSGMTHRGVFSIIVGDRGDWNFVVSVSSFWAL